MPAIKGPDRLPHLMMATLGGGLCHVENIWLTSFYKCFPPHRVGARFLGEGTVSAPESPTH